MNDANSNQSKPLRRTSNKIKDIYDAYVKNDKTKNIPINDGDENIDAGDNVESSLDSIQNPEQVSLDDAAFLEMHAKIEELDKAVNDSQSQIESLQKENNELKELSLRKTAELENFRKRSIKEKSDLIEYSNEKLLNSLIEILDDMNAAINASDKAMDAESLRKGLELIFNKSTKLFEEAGVKKMAFDENTEFDVNLHEAMMVAPSDKPEGTVLQVIQNGYMYKEKVLKHAKVITSSGNAN